MFCQNCGKQLPDGARFCDGCGMPVSAEAGPRSGCASRPQPAAPYARSAAPPIRQPAEEGGASGERKVSAHITLCEDGVYRWTYEYNLFRHPDLFLLIWRIFFFVALGIFGFMVILTLIEGDMDGERLLDSLMYFGIALLGMTALVGLSYLIYAAIMGGKYIVVFELDENGVNHLQIDRQAKKANAIGAAAILAGYLSRSLSMMATGINVRSEMRTSFRSTGKVRAYPKKNTIKLRETLSQNQIFVYPEDFDFVWNYILSRVPDRAKPESFRAPSQSGAGSK